jgi:hypothetical protein
MLDQIGAQNDRDGLSGASAIIQLHVKDSAITGVPTARQTDPFAGTSTQADQDSRGHCLNHCKTLAKPRIVPRVGFPCEQIFPGNAEIREWKLRAEFIAGQLTPMAIAAKVVTRMATELGQKLVVSSRQFDMCVEFFPAKMDLCVGPGSL